MPFPKPGEIGGAKEFKADLPPGIMGEIAKYVYDQSPRPVKEIALVAAIGLFAGICGRAYNTHTGAGLNLYLTLIAKTATGKEAMSSGTSKLLMAVKKTVPAALGFKGPAEI